MRRAAGAPSRGTAEPLRGVRRLIAEHMTRAHREVPPVTWVEEADFSGIDLEAARADGAQGLRRALEGVPRAERAPRRRRIVYLDRYDIGVAVQTDDGLVVPVVRDCDTASVDELATEVARLAEGARAGR